MYIPTSNEQSAQKTTPPAELASWFLDADAVRERGKLMADGNLATFLMVAGRTESSTIYLQEVDPGEAKTLNLTHLCPGTVRHPFQGADSEELEICLAKSDLTVADLPVGQLVLAGLKVSAGGHVRLLRLDLKEDLSWSKSPSQALPELAL